MAPTKPPAPQNGTHPRAKNSGNRRHETRGSATEADLAPGRLLDGQLDVCAKVASTAQAHGDLTLRLDQHVDSGREGKSFLNLSPSDG